MNGHPHPGLPAAGAARPVNEEAIRTLELLLGMAKTGQLVSVIAAYSYGPNHVEIKINALQPMEMYFGCEILRKTLFEYMTKPPISKVLRPFGG